MAPETCGIASIFQSTPTPPSPPPTALSHQTPVRAPCPTQNSPHRRHPRRPRRSQPLQPLCDAHDPRRHRHLPPAIPPHTPAQTPPRPTSNSKNHSKATKQSHTGRASPLSLVDKSDPESSLRPPSSIATQAVSAPHSSYGCSQAVSRGPDQVRPLSPVLIVDPSLPLELAYILL